MLDWQTEEEVEWDELPVAEEPTPVPTHRRRWGVFLLLVALFSGLLGLVLYQQLNRRVEVVADQLQTDALTSYELVYQSATQADVELFANQLSGRDPDWAEGQQRVVMADAFMDWPRFGLHQVPQQRVETAVKDFVVSPDLNSIEFVSEWAYTIDVGNGLTQTVVLSRTDVYRRGADRWLLAPPEDVFWGGTEVVTGTYLTLVFPERGC